MEADLLDPSPTTPAVTSVDHDRPEERLLEARWLGRIDYDDAYALQRRLAAERADGRIGDQLLLLEHPAVLTLGRNSDPAHILASAADLEARGIPVVRIERGGEVTYHGPGQLVAYPIVALHERGLLVRPFVRALEDALVATCAALGVAASRRDGHPGCWCDPDGPEPRKIGALGLRVERGVTLPRDRPQRHGRPGRLRAHRRVRHARRRLDVDRGELGQADAPPSTDSVARAASFFARALADAIDAPLAGELPG